MESRTRTNEGGFSLIEMAIASALFLMVFGAIWSTLDEGTEHAAHAMSRSTVEERARAILMRITEEVVNSGADPDATEHVLSHPRDVGGDESFLIFETRIGLDSTAADWSPRVDYFLRSSPGEQFGNGLDDDGDGMFDERELARLENGITTIVADDVLDFRATRTAGSDSIGLRITVARPDPASDEVLQATLTTRVALRNIPQF